nr:cytochrome c [Motiliproteus sediminis]
MLSVAAFRAAQAADLDEGKQLYDRFCARCHGADGYRTIPQAVDLARGQGLMKSNRQLQQRLEAGSGLCPSYRGLMESRDFTNLISYIRTLR